MMRNRTLLTQRYLLGHVTVGVSWTRNQSKSNVCFFLLFHKYGKTLILSTWNFRKLIYRLWELLAFCKIFGNSRLLWPDSSWTWSSDVELTGKFHESKNLQMTVPPYLFAAGYSVLTEMRPVSEVTYNCCLSSFPSSYAQVL